MDLPECSFDIKHRSGSSNGNSDVLSHLPGNEAPCLGEEVGYRHPRREFTGVSDFGKV